MKAKIILVSSFLVIAVILAVTLGCVYGIKLTVTIDYGYSEGSRILGFEPKIEEFKVTRGSTFSPERPTRSGYTFKGWYKDSALTIPWSSTDKVRSDMTLYAKWEAID